MSAPLFGEDVRRDLPRRWRRILETLTGAARVRDGRRTRPDAAGGPDSNAPRASWSIPVTAAIPQARPPFVASSRGHDAAAPVREGVEATAECGDDALDLAMAAARARVRAVPLSSSERADMLGAYGMSVVLGMSVVDVGRMRAAGSLLGLDSMGRDTVYPGWQVVDGAPLAGLAGLSALLGHDAWRMHAFLTGRHAEMGGDTAIEAMRAGRLDAVLRVARGAQPDASI